MVKASLHFTVQGGSFYGFNNLKLKKSSHGGTWVWVLVFMAIFLQYF